MEKLLFTRGLKLVTIADEHLLEEHYVFNKALLERNILILFFSYEIEEGLTETVVFVKAIDEEVAYSYNMYIEHNVLSTAPIHLARIITDLAEFIKYCRKDTVLEDLEEIAHSVSTSKQAGSKKKQAAAYNKAAEMFKIITADPL